MAGDSATHTVVLAQLVIDGQKKGVFWFFVQLRDLKSGEPMPGVNVGNVGSKSGRLGVDNGFIQFTNVRVPRENMLSRWAQVTKEGTFNPPPHPAISYATLIGERIYLVHLTLFY